LALIALIGNPRFDWCYESAPHAHMNGHTVPVPRGKTLGGSGSINSMVYIRGRPSDYDAWARLGCSGWDWESVLPYFIRAESNQRLADDPLHGGDGPLNVEDLRSPDPMLEQYVAAGKENGIPENRDFNGVSQEGIGTRWSAADAYLRPAKGRKNLHVVTNAEVESIDFEGKIARRVSLRGERDPIRIEAELILCAGAIGTPTLLLRSGVGPQDHLQELQIPFVHELPGVGENLHDHPAIAAFYDGGNSGRGLSLVTLHKLAAAPFQYLLARRGLFTSNLVESGGFARTDASLAEPDVQFHFIPSKVGHIGAKITWGRGYYGDVCVLKPASRGRLRLASAKIDDDPIIDLNMLSKNEDQQTLLRGLKLLRRVLGSPALSGSGANEVVPGPAVQRDDELLQYIYERLGTAYHPVGTCRMGDPADLMTVVGSNLRVIGLENVLIADASVMPEVVAGNTNAPTMMIADVAADRIMGKAGSP
jgi:choline dehydrogenase-like flavoprotein